MALGRMKRGALNVFRRIKSQADGQLLRNKGKKASALGANRKARAKADFVATKQGASKSNLPVPTQGDRSMPVARDMATGAGNTAGGAGTQAADVAQGAAGAGGGGNLPRQSVNWREGGQAGRRTIDIGGAGRGGRVGRAMGDVGRNVGRGLQRAGRAAQRNPRIAGGATAGAAAYAGGRRVLRGRG